MRPARAYREPLLIAVVALLFGALFSYPLLAHLGRAGFGDDWDYTFQMQLIEVLSLKLFHQFPMWNPYKCGGMPLLANPQSNFLSPFFLLELWRGPITGLQLQIPLHLALGFGGGYVLGRVLGMSVLASLLCAAIFPGSSWFYLHLGVGHAVFIPALYLPWIVAMLYLGVERGRWWYSGEGGAFLALTFLEGGVYSVSQALLLSAVLMAVVACQRRSLRPLLAVAVLGLFGAGLAGVKLMPSWAWDALMPRPAGYIIEYNSPLVLARSLFSRAQDPSLYPWRSGVGIYNFWEIGAYLGPFAALLALAGCIFSSRRALAFLVAGVVLLLLAMGDFHAGAPWSLLHRLPPFSQERVVSRFLIPFSLVAGVLAGLGADNLGRRFGRPATWLAALLAIAAVADMFSLGPPILDHVFGRQEPTIPYSPAFRQINGPMVRFLMYGLTAANIGAINCYEYSEPRSFARAFNEPGYRGEQYLSGPGSLTLTRWSPNEFDYRVELPVPELLIVNQNFVPGWKLAAGRGEVGSVGGLLALRLPPGRQELRLKYWAPQFNAGLALSLLSLCTLAALWFWERDRGLSKSEKADVPGAISDHQDRERD